MDTAAARVFGQVIGFTFSLGLLLVKDVVNSIKDGDIEHLVRIIGSSVLVYVVLFIVFRTIVWTVRSVWSSITFVLRLTALILILVAGTHVYHVGAETAWHQTQAWIIDQIHHHGVLLKATSATLRCSQWIAGTGYNWAQQQYTQLYSQAQQLLQ